MDKTTLGLVLATAFALLVVPGPVVLFTVARSIDRGRRAGLVSVLAAGLGDLCHVTAAAAGLSAVLLFSALAFSIVKYAGAAYLVYLGIRTLLSGGGAKDDEAVTAPAPLQRIFVQGLAVSVLNPKTALFFLAFLSQFVHPELAGVTQQILALGGLFVALGMVTNGAYVILASSVGSLLKGNLRFRTRQRYVAGGIYLALGVTTALSGSRAKQ